MVDCIYCQDTFKSMRALRTHVGKIHKQRHENNKKDNWDNDKNLEENKAPDSPTLQLKPFEAPSNKNILSVVVSPINIDSVSFL